MTRRMFLGTTAGALVLPFRPDPLVTVHCLIPCPSEPKPWQWVGIKKWPLSRIQARWNYSRDILAAQNYTLTWYHDRPDKFVL